MGILNKTGSGKQMIQRAASLTYTLHGLKRRHFLGAEKPVTVGRAATCDIRLPHQDVAPVQLRIEGSTKGELFLFSESGSVPTLVNGYPVEFTTLSPGDRIRIGPLTLKVDNKIVVSASGGLPDPIVAGYSDFGEALIRSLKKSHWLALSLAIHLAIVLAFSNAESPERSSSPFLGIMQDFLNDPMQDVAFEEPQDRMNDTPEETFPSEPLLPDPYPRSAFDAVSEEDLDLLVTEDALLPLGDSGSGRGGGDLGQAFGRRKETLPGDQNWQRFKDVLQQKGLDVAILFDSTGSMSGFIREVKDTIEEMVHVLRQVVPDCTICLMTYKGDAQSSAYVVHGTPLVKDPYELLNFMRSVSISGGSVEGYAAIATALTKAHRSLLWRDGTEKVIVLIGDAPPFPWKKKICLTVAGTFDGKIAAIYKQSSGLNLEMETDTISFFRKLSERGGGPFILYDEGKESVVRRIVSAVLGLEWEKQIEAVFEQKKSGRWVRIVNRRLAEGDLDWLICRFKKREVRPEVVEALIETGNRAVGRAMWRCIDSEEPLPPWLLQRVLYVLEPLAGVSLEYTGMTRNSLTPAQRVFIAEALKHTYGPGVLKASSDIIEAGVNGR